MRLTSGVLPSLTLLALPPDGSWVDGSLVTEVFHRHGVNIRHAGAVWAALVAAFLPMSLPRAQACLRVLRAIMEQQLQRAIGSISAVDVNGNDIDIANINRVMLNRRFDM